MMTTPLVGCGDKHLSPQSLLWTLLCQTLWIPVPSRLENFTQGKHLATFVGMTLDMFQSSSFVQHRQTQLQQQQQEKGTEGVASTSEDTGMEVDSVQTGSSSMSVLEQLERDAAVEPFRVMLDQRLKALEPIARDRPGFEGFVQGMTQYRERHPPLSLPLQGTSSSSATTLSLRKVRMG
jgi:hypothetical protein